MAKKVSTADRVRKAIESHPNATAAEIAQIAKTTKAYVYVVKHSMARKAEKVLKAKGIDIDAIHKKAEKMLEEMTKVPPMPPVPQFDMVNHPPHYTNGGIETIDFIEAKNLNYRLGNVVKYITRADLKGERLENLKKARWYLDREIKQAQSTHAS